MAPRPVRPRTREERRYQKQLQRFLRGLIQVPSLEIIAVAQSAEEVLTRTTDLTEVTLDQSGLGADLAETEFTRIERRHTAEFVKNMSASIPDIAQKVTQAGADAWIQARTRENVDLIRGLVAYQQETMNLHINKAITTGEFDRREIARVARVAFGAANSRAKLIGRDQVSKATGALTELRQNQVGVVRYRWLSAEDERVRPSHAANNGKIFEWGSPPPETGHPGHDINCRCVAVPILE